MPAFHQPEYDYTRPYISTAFWYLSHGIAPGEALARLESRFPGARNDLLEGAISYAARAVGYQRSLDKLFPFERLAAALPRGTPLDTTVGLRVLITLRTPQGDFEDISVTINVPIGWTVSQILDSVYFYVTSEEFPRNKGRHYEGEIASYQLFGLTGLAFQNPAMQLA